MIDELNLPKLDAVWLDVNEPSESELTQVALTYGLPVSTVHDCLDSLHLPKFERFDNADFLILRHYDPEAKGKPDYDTVKELTRKTALFIGKQFLITVHRKYPPFLKELREKLAHADKPPKHLFAIVTEIFQCTLASYEAPLNEAQDEMERFEGEIFSHLADASVLEEMYFLKRKISVYRRMIRQTIDILHRLPPDAYPRNTWSRAQERGERAFIAADEMVEEIHNLLSTQISLASHRTNEVMRVLTLFSAFFLPLTFIVGIYGMNFEFMPEIHWRHGYRFAWLLMASTTLAVFLWFRKKGWLR